MNTIQVFVSAMVCFRSSVVKLLTLCLVSASCSAQVAEIVWVEPSADANQILYSAWDGEKWSSPTAVVTEENSLSSPVISKTSQGRTILIWSEQQKRKMVLMQSSKGLGEADWRPSSTFSRFGSENVSPSIVRDTSENLWVFWAADVDSYSDIYFTKQHAGQWLEPQRVNPANNVPDIRPLANLNGLGQVVVRWQSYDFDVADYVMLEQLMSAPIENNASDTVKREEIDHLDIELPSFIPNEAYASLFVSSNIERQNSRVYQGSLDAR